MTKEEEWLGTASPAKLIFMLAVPSVAAQFINVLYNIVDRMYIGHIPEEGAVALTGVGLTFPIITIISAFSAFAGAGGAPLAAVEPNEATTFAFCERASTSLRMTSLA